MKCVNYFFEIGETSQFVLCKALKFLYYGRELSDGLRSNVGTKEKGELAVNTVEQAYRYIASIEGVRSGHPVVAGTRIGVHDVMGLILNGASVDDVVKSFPTLSRSQVYECLAYYEDHKAEVDLAVAGQMAERES